MSAQQSLNISIVCDPQRSVVVSACAGSGKTWLLVARLVRILLSGESPRSILALTFTRKAAQEMRERLYQLLQSWTTFSDPEIIKALMERGLDAEAAQTQLQAARTLYPRLLSNPHTVSIDTFHGWFGRLLAGAPVSMGAQSGFTLREDAKRLQEECLEDWWASMPSDILQQYEYLIDQLGSAQANQFLFGTHGLVQQKGAWVFFKKACEARGECVTQALRKCCNTLSQPNPLLTKLQESTASLELRMLHDAFSNGGVRDQQGLTELSAALDALEQQQLDKALHLLIPVFMTRDELPRSRKDNDAASKAIQTYLEGQNYDLNRFIAIRQAWASACEQYVEWQSQQQALALNQAWFSIGTAMLEHIERAKERMRVRDFDDLELGVAQMISDPHVAAYWQARLDARYRHILIDEFQDTNPLQWQILRAWLAAYGEDHQKPKVFIVGDPKQSIYRFRRADPRLFTAATHFLQKHDQAHLEQQNTTRRNAPAIVEAVNRIFTSDRIPKAYPFQIQKTLWHAPDIPSHANLAHGEAYRLPLIPIIDEPQANARDNALAMPHLDRRETGAKQQRLLEGQRLAQLIDTVMRTRLVLDEVVDPSHHQQRNHVWRPARPGDFLVLVKRRQYLPEYEEALRHANLLFESPRLGGLLETLEVDDLIALLTILSNPNHDLALAQILRSPLYGMNEAQMQMLSELVQSNRGYRNWWEALSHANDHPYADVFLGIAQQLMAWMELAKHLPVHDLLDHVYYSGDIRCKYASVCQPRDRDQVLANLDAFLELALNLDGGRYPSLGRFISQLKQMRRGDQDETPDEGEMRGEVPLDDEGDDVDEGDFDLDTHSIAHRQQRIRLMTIHGAKGLEAPFVIILDCNHTAITNPGRGVLLDWDPDHEAPNHLSMFTKLSLSKAREELVEQEKQIALHENWNLLYVALTRAKQGLWLSGVESARHRQQGGLVPDSWYERSCEGQVPVFTELEEASNAQTHSIASEPFSASEISFDFPDLVLTWHGTPSTSLETQALGIDEQRRMQEGEWFHQILERITPSQYRMADAIPDPQSLASRLGIDEVSAERTIKRAHSVFTSPELSSLFNPESYRNAWNELDVVSEDGRCLRIDRLVEFDHELVVLDYKLSIPEQADPLYTQYQQQLGRYCQAVRKLFPNKLVRSLLIDSRGRGANLLN